MNLDDIYYFGHKKENHPAVYQLAKRAVDLSQKDKRNKTEIERRIALLAKSKNTEHLRQCSNFLAEAATFVKLFEQGASPLWVLESKNPSPDLEYSQEKTRIPIEVKHLNSPHEEHEAIASGRMIGGSVNRNYHLGLVKKIEDYISDATRKFEDFNQRQNGIKSAKGILYIYFSKSIDASIIDGIEWEVKMMDRILNIANQLKGNNIELVVVDLQKLVDGKT